MPKGVPEARGGIPGSDRLGVKGPWLFWKLAGEEVVMLGNGRSFQSLGPVKAAPRRHHELEPQRDTP